jgi:hypothetical protein
VHGPNPAHGLGLSGVAAYGAGRIGLPAWLGPLGEAGQRGARPRVTSAAQWPRARRSFAAAGAIGAEVQV